MRLLKRNAAFRWLWGGQFLSQLGNAVFLIMGLWEIQLRSPVLLSLVGLAMALPAILSVAGGAVVDQYHPGRIMLLTDIMRGTAVAVGLVALAIPGSLVPVIIVLLGINSLGNALFGPAESVLLPALVHDGDLVAANGVYSLTGQLSNALGLVLGGAAVAAIGVALVFGMDLASFWLSALGLLLMLQTLRRRPSAPLAPLAVEAASAGRRHHLRDGLRVLRSIPGMRQVLPLIALVNFAYTAAFTMLPFWVNHRLHGDALWYGLVAAGWAAGIVVGGVLAGAAGRWPLRVSAAVSYGSMALLVGGFALSASPVESSILLLGAGVGNGVGNAVFYTMEQRLIPAAVRGRIFGLLFSLINVANPLGAVAAGAALLVLPLYWSWAAYAGLGLVFAMALVIYIPSELAPQKTPGEGNPEEMGHA